MNILDTRTVLFSSVITSSICAVVMLSLWQQNRRHSPELKYWLADFVLQFLAVLFIALRGVLPSVVSVGLGVPFSLAGALLLFVGLEKYLGKTSRHRYNLGLLGVFSLMHLYFAFGQPSLSARNLNLSLGLLLFCGQCAWLLLRRREATLRAETKVVGVIFGLYSLISLLRIGVDMTIPQTDDIFKSGLYDTLAILIYQILLISLTFALFLMVNRRLFTSLDNDITARIQAEEALRKSEGEYRNLFQNAQVGMYRSRLDGSALLAVNHKLAEILGYSIEEMLTEPATLHWADPADRAEMVRRLLDKGVLLDYETPVVTRSGERRTCLAAAKLYAQEGYLEGSVIDITERKRADENLQASEERYRTVADYTFDWEYWQAPDGTIRYMSPSCELITGYRAEEFIEDPNRLETIVHRDDRSIFEQHKLSTRSTNRQEVHETDFRIIHRDGEVRWIGHTCQLIRRADGTSLGRRATNRDITARKQAESQRETALLALRDSENTMRAWLNAVQESALLIDRDGLVLAANATVARRLQCPIEELVGACIYDFLPPQNAHARQLHVAKVIESNQPVRFEDERAGRIIDNLIYPVFDQAGQVKHLAILGTDITERKQLEDALRASEYNYRSILEQASDGIFIADPNGRYVEVNASGCAMLGYTRDEILARKITDLVAPDDLASTPLRMEELRQGKVILSERRLLRKDGSVVPVEISARMLPDGRLQAIQRDITERKQTEEVRQEIERVKTDLLEKLNEAQHLAMIGSWEWDLLTHDVWWSDETYRIFGVTRQEFVPGFEANGQFIHPDDFARYGQVFERSLRTGEPLDTDFRLNANDGLLKHCHARGKVVYSDAGQPLRFIGTIMDVTERRQAEQARHESEARYRLISENSADVIWLLDPDTLMFTYVSPAVYRLRGYTPEEVIAESAQAALSPADYQRIKGGLQPRIDAFRRGDESARIRVSETDQPHKDGSVVKTEVVTTLLTDAQGQVVQILGVTRDITARKQAEEKLRESEERYRSLFEHMVEGYAYCQMIFEGDQPVDWIYLAVNESFSTLTGLKDVNGKRVSEVIPGIRESDPGLFALYARAALTGQHAKFETFVEALQMWFAVSVYSPAEGFFVAVFDVITERKQAEERLAYQANLLANVRDVVTASDDRFRLTLWNHAAEDTFGWKSEEVLGRPGQEVFRSEFIGIDRAEVLRSVMDTGQFRGEMIQYRKDGRPLYVEANTFAVRNDQGQITGYVTVSRDITGRKQAEEALRLANERIRRLVDSNIIGILIANAAGDVLEANDYYLKLIGYTREELDQGRVDWRAITPPEWLPADEQAIKELRERGICTPYEKEYLLRDGSRVPVLLADTMLPGPGEQIAAFALDITERKHAEEALRFHQAILEETGHIARVGGWSIDALTGEGYWTDEVARIHDVDPALPISKEIGLQYYTPESRPIIEAAVQAVIEQGVSYDLELGIVSATGRRKWIRTIGHPLTENGKVVQVRGSFQDITDRKQAEVTLRESEERFRRAVLQAPIPMLIHDEDDQNYTLSQGWTKYSGYTLDDIPTMGDWTERAYGERSSFVKEYIDNLFQINETVSNGEWVINTKDGRQRIWDFYTTPLGVAGNGKRLLLSIAVDVSERKQAEEQLRASEQKFKTVFEIAPVGISLLDKDRNLLAANDQLEKITRITQTGLQAGIYRNRKYLRADGTPLPPSEIPSVQVITEHRPIYGVVNGIVIENEQVIWTRVSAAPLNLPDTSVVVITQDITEQKQAEDQIRRLNAELEQRVVERTAQLEAANKELEAFAYSVSHDLRAPLRAIDGFSRILLEDYADHFDAEGQRLFGVVRDNTQKMDRLITDLLALSRVTRSQLLSSRLDMSTLVKSVYADIAAPEVRTQLTFTVAPLPEASGDATLLRQVWNNLISNAMKYTRPRAAPHIDIGGYVRDGETVYFIRDNGVGFNPDYTHKLFGIFQRLHKAEDFEGTGVGLAIVQRIVQRHGGRVWAEGRLNDGATFYFSLPHQEVRDD